MSYPKNKQPVQQSPTNNNSLDNEFTMLIFGALILFMLYGIFGTLAWFSVFLYAPFTYLPLKLTINYGWIGGFLCFLLFAAICYLMDKLIGLRFKKALQKKIDPERSRGFLYLSGYWVFMAVYIIIDSNPASNLFFQQIYTICNPSDINKPFSTCLISFKSVVFDVTWAEIAYSSFLPNLMFIIPILPEIIKSFGRISQHPKNKIIKKLDIPDLIDVSQPNFAHLRFYKKINPCLHDLNEGVFALLLQSRQFALKENLITGFIERPDDFASVRTVGVKQDINSSEQALTSEKKDSYIPVVDAEKFEHVMLKQLGNVWTGDINDLSASEIMILAIALPQCCLLETTMSRSKAQKIQKETLEKIDSIWIWLADVLETVKLGRRDKNRKKWPDGYDLSKLPSLETYPNYFKFKKELENEWFKNPIFTEIVSKHAYTNTIIYEVILNARKVGVLQPSSTRWMRLYDRSLFALIQNVGRPSVYAENMGTVSHYYAEKRNKQKLLKPDFAAAFAGFNDRLSIFLYTKEDCEAFKNGTLNYIIRIDKDDDGVTIKQ